MPTGEIDGNSICLVFDYQLELVYKLEPVLIFVSTETRIFLERKKSLFLTSGKHE